MPSSSSDYSTQIISQIKTLLPDLSLDPLTPERKIVDVLADVLSQGSIDPYVLSYMFDIDTKVGSDLDAFVALFGFARKSGTQATGIVTFSRAAPATADIIIPSGTNVLVPASASDSQVTFITTAAAILPNGSSSVDVPIQCTDVGPQGNVPANAVNQFSNNADLSGVNNSAATTGGAGPEVDADLRLRFKNTIFRNVSGTRDQFLALALATVFANKANVLGPQDRYVEYLQIPSTASTASIISYSKYTYPFNYYLTDGNIGAENFYNGNGIDYTFNTSVPPVITLAFLSAPTSLAATPHASGGSLGAGTYYYTVTALDSSGETTVSNEVNSGALSGSVNYVSLTWNAVSGATSYRIYRGNSGAGSENVFFTSSTNSFSDTGTSPSSSVPPSTNSAINSNISIGQVVLLEHAYCSVNSRNDPASNILNFVDVYVNGDDSTAATDVVQFGSAVFSSSSSNAYYNEKWERVSDNSNPVVGNYFTQALWQPVDTIPSVITINNQDYLLGIHYWQIKDVTVNKGSKNALDGIEWASTVGNVVTSTMQFTYTYNFNELPSVLNELMDEYKQTTSDVLVHAATERYFIVNIVTMYSPGFAQDSVDTDIDTALTAYFQNLNFGDIVQISDILEIVHEVSGVDNVRLATPGDGVAYGIQEVTSSGAFVGLPFTTDFELADCELGVLDGMVSTRKAQNTF